uniref:PGG domain-containing protein n=1 Tax=Oryza brachyantha TaxID=4533 RepID=J3MWY2_ORYBR
MANGYVPLILAVCLLLLHVALPPVAGEMVAGDLQVVTMCPTGRVQDHDDGDDDCARIADTHSARHGTVCPAPGGGGDDGLMATTTSSLLERTEADEAARRREHRPACVHHYSIFVAAAGVGGDRSMPALTVIADPIHDIHQPVPKSGRARLNCSAPSASGVLDDAPRPEEAAGAAAGDSHHVAAALSELSSDNHYFDWTVQIQSSIADRLFVLTTMTVVMTMAVGRAKQRRRRRAACSSSAVLMMLLVAVAFADSATAARPLPAAAALGTALAASGRSSCTADPNTQDPVRCNHH